MASPGYRHRHRHLVRTFFALAVSLPLLSACEGLFPDVAADAGGSGCAAGTAACPVIVLRGMDPGKTPSPTQSKKGQAVGDQGSPGKEEAAPMPEDPGVAAFQAFLEASGNKAFAVAPDGSWGWRASSALPLEAVQAEARANCARHAIGCQVILTAPAIQGVASLPK